jgi:tRNA dimethylallyltransferase
MTSRPARRAACSTRWRPGSSARRRPWTARSRSSRRRPGRDPRHHQPGLPRRRRRPRSTRRRSPRAGRGRGRVRCARPGRGGRVQARGWGPLTVALAAAAWRAARSPRSLPRPPRRRAGGGSAGDVSEVLAIVGPTASGKSALALDVARQRTAAGRPTELVAVDAFTIYRGMDIGTATPTGSERAEVPHHLVDVLDPWEELTVAAFQRLARRDRRRAGPRGDPAAGRRLRAVLAGGRRRPALPAHRPARPRPARGALGERPLAAHAHLATLDPAAAARIDPANLRRTVRALEVIELTGTRSPPSTTAGTATTASSGRSRSPTSNRRGRAARADRCPGDGDGRGRAARRGGARCGRCRARCRGPPRRRSGTRRRSRCSTASVAGGGARSHDRRRTWRYARRQRAWFRADPRCEPTDPVRPQRLAAGARAGDRRARRRGRATRARPDPHRAVSSAGWSSPRRTARRTTSSCSPTSTTASSCRTCSCARSRTGAAGSAATA